MTMTSFPCHAELAENPCRSEVARVTGGIDAVELKFLEPARQQLPADRRSDALPPNPRMHRIGDLTLTLPSAPDVKLPDADHLAIDTRYMSEPLPRRMRPGLDRGHHEDARLLFGVRSPRLEAADLGEGSPGVDSPPVCELDPAQGHRMPSHELILPDTAAAPTSPFKKRH